ncbi:MAG: DM13 domain-containing protein [Bacteroidota bacterium]
MKRVFILLVVILLMSCKEEDATPNGPIDDSFDPSMATLLKSGALVGVGHTVSGTAAIYDSAGRKTVLLDPYSSQNGPDLKVYLSKDAGASSYISLGKLKSTNGKQSYEIPGDPDVTDYNYVLVWCEQFSVIFGKAELK